MRNALKGWFGAVPGVLGAAAFLTVGAGLAGCDEIVVVEDLPDTGQCDLLITFVDSPGAKTVVEGATLTFNLTGQGDARGVYTYTVASQPAGASLDPDDGVFTYTPNLEVSTITTDTPFDVKFTVSVPPTAECPNGAQSTAITVTITVLNDQDDDRLADDDDPDRDGDGLDNGLDTAPDDPDRDDDTELDGADNCPDDANESQADEDDDDVGDACDDCPGDPVNDPDGDDICANSGGEIDNCPNVRNEKEDCDGNGATPEEQCDFDEDGLGEVLSAGSGESCDPCPNDPVNDPDLDRACASRNGQPYDICPTVDNAFDCAGNPVIDASGNLTGEQCDTDGDDLGDECDTCPEDATNDEDGDDVCEDVDNCPGVSNPEVGGAQPDKNGDGEGDACDPDIDGDTVANGADNCPDDANLDQRDTDGDLDGDACDSDDDDDGVLDGAPDNCPLVENPNQLDFDDDGIGYQCDTLETVPFAVHQGTAVDRVDGDAQAGTVAIAFRGPNPCAGAACVKPGVFVVDEADESYVHRQEDAGTAWLDLQPPGGDLFPPYVAQNGAAFFPADTAAGTGFDLYKVAVGAAAKVFPSTGVFAIMNLHDAPDGKTIIEGPTTAVGSTRALWVAETLNNGEPSQLLNSQAAEFVDSATPPNGPRTFADETLYVPMRQLAGYQLRTYKKDGSWGTSAVTFQFAASGGNPNLTIQNVSSLQFVALDRVTGSPWYCWLSNDNARTSYFQMQGGSVVRHRKTNWDRPCSEIRAEQAPSGAWLFIGPGTTPTNRRLTVWLPDTDLNPTNDTSTQLADVPLNGAGTGSTGVVGTVALYHTAGHTFVEWRQGTAPDSTHDYFWFNPAVPGTPVRVGTGPIYNAISAIDVATNRIGIVGRSVPNGDTGGAFIARRFQGGVSAGAGDEKVLEPAVTDFDALSRVWTLPTGALLTEYRLATPNVTYINSVPVTASVPAARLSVTQSATVTVSVHGATTLVSFKPTGGGAGQVAAYQETPSVGLTKLVDTKGGALTTFQHVAYQSTVVPAASDAFISYLATGAETTWNIARVTTSGTPTLTTVLTGLLGPPVAPDIGPDNAAWFGYETNDGYGVASTSGATFSPFVSDAVDLRLVKHARGANRSLWGVAAQNAAGDWYACRVPVTVGPNPLAAGCWQAAAATGAAPLWWDVDEREQFHLVTSAGSPLDVTLFRSIGEPELLPADIP